MNKFTDDVLTLRQAGLKELAEQYYNMRVALSVIHTWASFRIEMGFETDTADKILKLTEKALGRYLEK